MITKENALLTLRPGAQWTTRGDVIEWLDSEQTQPTEEEINAEVSRLQAEHDAQEYARKRKAEYPSIEECVHAILDDDLDALQVKRAEIKARYPK